MPRIADKERELYEELNASVPAYGDFSPGCKYLERFLELSGAQAGDWVIDAGCSTGKMGLELATRDFHVSLVDQTESGLAPEVRARLAENPSERVFEFHEHPLYQPGIARACHAFSTGDSMKDDDGAVDWVVCCDVMEHIPPQFTMLVAHHLVQAAVQGVFFSIATVPDAFGTWVGQTLHKTVQPFVVWRDSLAEVGEVAVAVDLLNTGLFLVKRRDA